MSLSTKKVLDDSGLAYVWSKIKNLVSSKTATVVQTITAGTKIGSVDSTDLYTPYFLAYGNASGSGTARSITATGFKLVQGAVVCVLFTYAVGDNATLNVNSTGSKSIYYKDLPIKSGIISASDVGVFVYDGYYWRLIAVNTNIGATTVYGTCTPTSSSSMWATTDRPLTKIPGATAIIKFTANVTASSPSLQVGDVNLGVWGKIKYQGADLQSGVIMAGDTCMFVHDGTNWNLITIDSHIGGGSYVSGDATPY